MNVYGDFTAILIFIKNYFFQILSLVLSALLFLTAYLSYKNYTLTTLSAYMRTMVMPSGVWKIDVTGSIFPGERYLDLIITNGGPGIAKNVCWYLYEKSSEGSQRSVANGMLPYSYVGRDANVRGYIKIYDEDVFDTKYIVSLTHSGPLTKKRREISLEFNSFGDLLVAKNHKCFHFSRVKT